MRCGEAKGEEGRMYGSNGEEGNCMDRRGIRERTEVKGEDIGKQEGGAPTYGFLRPDFAIRQGWRLRKQGGGIEYRET